MEIPNYQPFYLPTVESLRAEIARLGLTIPVEGKDFATLGEPLAIGGVRIPNRFCAQPIAGCDAAPDGAPSILTRHRYFRYARGGFGLLWLEATAGGVPNQLGQLALSPATLPAFRSFASDLHESANPSPTLILQLVATEPNRLVEAAVLAEEAGFDGVDLQLSRPLLAETLALVRQAAPHLLLATRLCAYEAVRDGFGVSPGDYRVPDLTGPIQLVATLRRNGLALLNVTAHSPLLRGPDRGARAHSDSAIPDEHPLSTLARQLWLARGLRESVPGLPVVGSGLSWLRHWLPHVAAAALAEGIFDLAGLGRAALASPDAPRQILAQGDLPAGSACMVCFACSQLHDQGEPVGCVLRDPETYGPIYRQMRRFDSELLMAGAQRCHLCEAAPCQAASPSRTEIPAFIQAFRQGDEDRAYEIIRRRDPLPELTSRLAPGWMESEGACIETTLAGKSVPILDLQYAISWRARERGATGVRFPAEASGRRVQIVGAGPAGLAATVRLVELGHIVHLHEASRRLGGVPARVLQASRGLDPRAEIDAILKPALAAGRLQLRLGQTADIGALGDGFDAVLVATGLWQERSLGTPEGVWGSLRFLESPPDTIPARVAILAGGDSAMDSARLAQARGAREISILFGGPRSALHWHMPETWFAMPGVHLMTDCEPLGYEIDAPGRLRAVRLRHDRLGGESLLPVDLAIEAMELQPAEAIRTLLAQPPSWLYAAGALLNGGASVGHCVADGLAAAEAIDRDLSS